MQSSTGEEIFDNAPNPMTASELLKYCRRLVIPGPSRPTLSITGGEPLLQGSFLAEWIPLVRRDFRIYLETNGIHAASLGDLHRQVDVISMDFKLPSATGLGPYWDEHRKFLRAAGGTALFVKAVVTNDTVSEDLTIAASIIAEFNRAIPFIIQPATGAFAPEASKLIQFQNESLGLLEDVRVIPQVHKFMSIQ